MRKRATRITRVRPVKKARRVIKAKKATRITPVKHMTPAARARAVKKATRGFHGSQGHQIGRK